MNLRDAAIAWAKRGFRVFPLIPNQKKPLWTGWQDIATTDVEIIADWWTDRALGENTVAQWNIGYLTDDLLVPDIDVKHGPEALEFYQNDLYMEVGQTLTVQTPSGGLHCIYYGENAKSSANQVAKGLDIRGVGGLAVAPGSVINGVPYKILHDVPVIQAPVHLAKAAGYTGPRVSANYTPVIELDNPMAWSQGEWLAANTEAPQEGGRDDACFKLACELKDVGLSKESAGSLIAQHWADRCMPAFPEEEVLHAVASAYASGKNPPGIKNALVVAGFTRGWAPVPFEGLSLDGPIENEANYAQASGFDSRKMFFGNVRPLAELKSRDWIMQRMLIRGEITAVIAPGGVGKSQFGIYLAICLAAGVDMLGFANMKPGQPQRTVIYNAEDSMDELALRFYAQCHVLEIDPDKVAPYILFISGKDKDTKFRITDPETPDKNYPKENAAAVKAVKDAIGDHEVALFIGDPLVKLHSSSENDNGAMTRVMELFESFITGMGAAGLLMHHTNKPQGVVAGIAGNIDSLRGASGIKDAARACFTLAPPSKEDITKYGLSDHQARFHLRLDDAKMNRGIMGDPVWMQKHERLIPTVGGRMEPVGAFGPADIAAIGAAAASRMAEIIDGAINQLHASSISMIEAVKAVQRVDPLANNYSEKDMRLRLTMMFQSKVITPVTGTPLQTIDGGKSIQVVS